jgi:hypothetical protein
MIEQLEAIALKSIALKDMSYLHRKICRYYSHNFHTPLLEVYELPWPFVFTNYIEHIIESGHNQESIYNLVIDTCYPEKKVDEEEQIQERIREIELEEDMKRQAKKKKGLAKNPPIDSKVNKDSSPDISMESSSFAHLNDEMKEEK